LVGVLTLETRRPVGRTRRHGHRRRLVVAKRIVHVPLGPEELLLVQLAKPVVGPCAASAEWTLTPA
jgi:hypothetical protein